MVRLATFFYITAVLDLVTYAKRLLALAVKRTTFGIFGNRQIFSVFEQK